MAGSCCWRRSRAAARHLDIDGDARVMPRHVRFVATTLKSDHVYADRPDHAAVRTDGQYQGRVLAVEASWRLAAAAGTMSAVGVLDAEGGVFVSLMTGSSGGAVWDPGKGLV